MTAEHSLFEYQSHSTRRWLPLPHVDEAQMREVDRIAVEDFGLGILQMMENAGRSLANLAARSLGELPGANVTVFPGSGGNGGGGLCAARHLHNHGAAISITLSRTEQELHGPAKEQLNILLQSGLEITPTSQADEAIARADLILDALIGLH